MDPIAEQLVGRLRSDPNDHAAYQDLVVHYRLHGDFASLANLLEGWAANHTEQWQEASQAFTEAAEAVLAGTGDRARAKQLFRDALQLDVGHPHAGGALIGLLEEGREYQELAEFLDVYARTLEQAGASAEFVAQLYDRLGTIWKDQFARADIAEQCATHAAQLRASVAPPPEAGPAPSVQPAPNPQAEATALGLVERAADEPDVEAKVALLAELATIQLEQLGDVNAAIRTLREALGHAPGDVAVMHQLATALLVRASTADPQMARGDQRRVAELFYQIAQGVTETDALPYLESALQAMPDHEGALALLERLAPELGRGDLLPRYWVAYVATAGDGPDLDARRVLLGQAYLHAGQADDAIYCLQAAAEHGSERAHELLQQAYALQANAAPKDQPVEAPSARDRLPTHRPPPRPSDQERARDAAKIAELRKQVQDALVSRRHDDAAEVCRQILELDPSDPEAFNLLEAHLRKRRDYAGLRDLLLASTRMPGLAVDARKVRLREVATLSEAKLRDNEGAISAWRGVVTLDPSDRDATATLKRLLKRAQQWDELTSVLEREAVATTTLEEKVALIREIALIHRDKRKDPAETAEALRQLHALRPDDAATRDELCSLLSTLEQWADVVPLLRERIDSTTDEIDKLKLYVQLAELLHDRLADGDAAYEACERILELKPNDKTAFDRMERIDEASANHRRLLGTLERRALLAPKVERPALFVRMGTIAEEQLADFDKAADYFGDALDLSPENADALARLVRLYEQAGRYTELIELLRERTLLEKDPRSRAPLHRRIATILAEQLGDEAGAAEAYRKLLDVEEDVPALRFLCELARRKDAADDQAHFLARLAPCVEDPIERRDLWFDLAVLLHNRLSRPHEAAATVKRIVQEVDPSFEPAIELLREISESSGDSANLSVALERQLALTTTVEARIPLAKRLAELYDQALPNPERSIIALQQWARDDAHDPEPRRRLSPLLRAAQQWEPLLTVLDELTECEYDFDARDAARIAAARIAFEQLADAQGAWNRLAPLVEERNETAEQALRELASRAGLQAQLAALYVRLAQEGDDSTVQASYWERAADVLEKELSDEKQAFEASLRMLASDLRNRVFLDRVDRLAGKTDNFRRLTQVYDRLLRTAQNDEEKVELLLRHATLLEPAQPEEALDRVLRACALDPDDEGLLERAEALALRVHRSEELLVVYDRRRNRSEDDRDKVRLLLRAAKLCDGALRDRERANQYLKAALAAASSASAPPEVAAEVDAVAAELDTARPELGEDNARRALVRAHREVAERVDAEVATKLLLRAAGLLRKELDDERGAFDLLRQALSLLPKSEEVYGAFYRMAEELKRLDALDAHLARLVDEAIDSGTAVELLKRRGALLEGPLNRFQDAAAVYTKLLQLRADDAEAAEKLRASLRRSGRFQDLLLALNKQRERTRDPARRLELLKEIASTWELDLKNRWEALDAWKAVLRETDDADAVAAVSRLERARGSASLERSLDSSEPPAPEASATARAEPVSSEVARDAAPTEARGATPPAAIQDGEPPAAAEASAPGSEAASAQEPAPVAKPEGKGRGRKKRKSKKGEAAPSLSPAEPTSELPPASVSPEPASAEATSDLPGAAASEQPPSMREPASLAPEAEARGTLPGAESSAGEEAPHAEPGTEAELPSVSAASEEPAPAAPFDTEATAEALQARAAAPAEEPGADTTQSPAREPARDPFAALPFDEATSPDALAAVVPAATAAELAGDDVGDLAALDARLSASFSQVEELDLIDDTAAAAVSIDVEVAVPASAHPPAVLPPLPRKGPQGSAPPPPPRISRPPVPPPRPSSLPPLGGLVRPSPPPLPRSSYPVPPAEAAKDSAAPPARRTSAPPPLPSVREAQARPPSLPPPLPPGTPATRSKPPALPPPPRKS